jgi:hypothetical protein
MVKIERDGAVNLRSLQQREVLVDSLGRTALVELADDGIERHAGSSHVVTVVPLLHVFPVHRAQIPT